MDRKKLEQLIFDTCSVEPDYPWMDTPESAVFRHPGNRKWFPADGAGLLPGLPYEQGQLDHGSVGRQCTG